ncbi:MAG: alpha/beta fold hydrolase [Candidatus Sphingomonas colombiensis]|nr:alpha/beta fold hydrolase [Sphingomonas sp.]WEK42162.1 MAG: alpha/beta fold hydrolase [Sphingomonas sp.]
MISVVRTLLVAVAAILMTSPALAASARHGGPGAVTASARLSGAPAGASAYRIHYRSSDPAGKPVVVTGAVIVPSGRAPAGGRNVVVWAHGASGVAESCGLSDKPGFYDQIAGLNALLAAGYVVAAPDYQGLGSAGPHPFLVGVASAHSVIDAVRAARAMPQANAGRRYALFGESLGGYSVLWAAIEAARYAPELQLVGVAAAAPPTDLKANLTGGTNAAVRAFLTAYTASSWEKVYSLPLTTVVKPGTATLIHALARNCVTLDGFKLRTKIGMLRLAMQLRNVDLAASPRWSALMERNSIDPAKLTVPMFIAQGGADAIVAPGVTRNFVAALCRRRAVVQFMSIDGGDHVSVGKRSASAAIPWINDRFAGHQTSGNCAR